MLMLMRMMCMGVVLFLLLKPIPSVSEAVAGGGGGGKYYSIGNLSHVECVEEYIASMKDLVSGNIVVVDPPTFRRPPNSTFVIFARRTRPSFLEKCARLHYYDNNAVYLGASRTDSKFEFKAYGGGDHKFCIRIPYSIPRGKVQFHIQVNHTYYLPWGVHEETRTTVISRDVDGKANDETGTRWTCEVPDDDDEEQQQQQCSQQYRQIKRYAKNHDDEFKKFKAPPEDVDWGEGDIRHHHYYPYF